MLGLVGCLAVIGLLATYVVPGTPSGAILGVWICGFYALLRWGNRSVGKIATTPNTRHEPLLLLLFLAIILSVLAIHTMLFGPHEATPACGAAIVVILTVLGLRTWSMNYAAFDDRLPPKFQYSAEREARWINFGRPVRPPSGKNPPNGP